MAKAKKPDTAAKEAKPKTEKNVKNRERVGKTSRAV